ncbi:MAG: trigger factor [Chitinivibrionales bacterium]|nr:trigger factor [Chitinivibrionales bacterium]
MKTDIVHVNDVERRLTVSLPPESVDSEIENAYRDLKKKVKLKGFRPGKAPRSILEKHFKAQVEEDVISKLVNASYPNALEELKMAPVSQPKIENGVLEKGREFTYTAVFEIKPEIDITGYEGLELTRKCTEVSQDDIAKEIEALRNSQATLKEVGGRSVRKNDCVIVDFNSRIGDEPLPGGDRSDFLMEVTDDAYLPGFPDQLIGLGKGDKKEFTLSIPDDYTDEHIAGKSVSFAVTVKEIKEKIMPDADDEFAKDLGGYTGLEDLKNKLREKLQERKKQESDADLRQQIFAALAEKNPFEVPKSFVENQIKNMMLDTRQMLAAQGVKMEDLGQTMGNLYEQYKAPAEKQVRSAMILEAVAEKEGLEAEDKDFEARYNEFAKQYQQDVKAVKAKITADMLRPQILEKKALDFIIEKAKISE